MAGAIDRAASAAASAKTAPPCGRRRRPSADRRDARALVRLFRAGEPTPIHVPDDGSGAPGSTPPARGGAGR